MLQPLLSLIRPLDFYYMLRILKQLFHGRSISCQLEPITVKILVKNVLATLIGPLKIAHLVDLYGFNVYEQISLLRLNMKSSSTKTPSFQVDNHGNALL